jgi:hypothetical protein
MYFESERHKEHFLAATQAYGKVDGGRIDAKYGAALYILTAYEGMWRVYQPYLEKERDTIPFGAMFANRGFTPSYGTLMRIAANLFDETVAHVDPAEFMKLNEEDYKMALTALEIRRYSPLLADL